MIKFNDADADALMLWRALDGNGAVIIETTDPSKLPESATIQRCYAEEPGPTWITVTR